jgi:hypothetical protein
LKVREVEHPTLGKQVQFWCAGCGQFHEAPRENWNGDLERPNIKPSTGPSYHTFNEGKCSCFVQAGVLYWSHDSQHRLAGKSQPLQNEEAWRPHGIPWDAKLEGPPVVLS